MDISEFMNSIYIGDRYVKEIIIDSYKQELKIKINLISRIRSKDGNWNYYNDENIEDGYLVFLGLNSFAMEPQGAIPNAEINEWEIERKGVDLYEITLYTGSYAESGEYKQVILKIIASNVCLENPKNINERVYD